MLSLALTEILHRVHKIKDPIVETTRQRTEVMRLEGPLLLLSMLGQATTRKDNGKNQGSSGALLKDGEALSIRWVAVLHMMA